MKLLVIGLLLGLVCDQAMEVTAQAESSFHGENTPRLDRSFNTNFRSSSIRNRDDFRGGNSGSGIGRFRSSNNRFSSSGRLSNNNRFNNNDRSNNNNRFSDSNRFSGRFDNNDRFNDNNRFSNGFNNNNRFRGSSSTQGRTRNFGNNDFSWNAHERFPQGRTRGSSSNSNFDLFGSSSNQQQFNQFGVDPIFGTSGQSWRTSGVGNTGFGVGNTGFGFGGGPAWMVYPWDDVSLEIFDDRKKRNTGSSSASKPKA